MLEVTNLNVYYGAVHAVKDASITVTEGELVAILGSNGSGKSTLLNAILGIVKASGGRCTFNGRRIDNLPPHAVVKQGISLLPQGAQLFPNMTVRENLELGCTGGAGRRAVKQKLEEVFQEFPLLYERRKQNAVTLSGGEQQILAMARALMSSPKLLLLDEPSAGLAPIVIEELARDVLIPLRTRGLPMLLVEQNAFLALELAERAYVMESGAIVKDDRAERLFDSDDVRKAYLGV